MGTSLELKVISQKIGNSYFIFSYEIGRNNLQVNRQNKTYPNPSYEMLPDV